MIIKQLSIFLEDKTGSLARVTGILARHGINMSAFCVADATYYQKNIDFFTQPGVALSIHHCGHGRGSLICCNSSVFGCIISKF